MPEQKIKNLMSELHELFGDSQVSAEQAALLKSVEDHVHSSAERDLPEPSMLESLELLVSEIEEEHPKASAVVGQIVNALKNMGI